MGRTSSTSSSSTATDAELWADFARGIRPLRGRATRDAPTQREPLRPAAERIAPAHPDIATPDRRTLENLKRGRMRPEARLDLHGMTREEAFAQLSGFVARTQAGGLRVALVITGRSGVLREEVPRWLMTTGLRPRILGVAEAKPRDGGAGALYVLIRRARA
jgi:DNA-nicking Smr family endonuclease